MQDSVLGAAVALFSSYSTSTVKVAAASALTTAIFGMSFHNVISIPFSEFVLPGVTECLEIGEHAVASWFRFVFGGGSVSRPEVGDNFVSVDRCPWQRCCLRAHARVTETIGPLWV